MDKPANIYIPFSINQRGISSIGTIIRGIYIVPLPTVQYPISSPRAKSIAYYHYNIEVMVKETETETELLYTVFISTLFLINTKDKDIKSDNMIIELLIHE